MLYEKPYKQDEKNLQTRRNFLQYIHISDKSLISILYKDHSKLNSKKAKNPFRAWAKHMKRHFTRKERYMTNKHMKIHSTLFAIMEMQI